MVAALFVSISLELVADVFVAASVEGPLPSSLPETEGLVAPELDDGSADDEFMGLA